MITCSKEVDSTRKQEGNASDGKITKAASSSTPWLKLKDPRIVRVSRAFGGKDRHSKVCTIRGLRDRRVRLSVPTAIQLYGLQDRLGLNQPSKVVDWLLDAAKDEIDELPPLPIPPGSFSLNHQQMLTSHEVGASQSSKDGFKISSNVNWGVDPTGLLFSKSNFWNSDALWRARSKEVARETVNDKKILIKRNDKEKQEGNEAHGAQVSSNNLLPRTDHSSSSTGLLNNAIPYGSYYNLEPSHFPLPHFGSHVLTSPTEDLHNLSIVPLPPAALSLSSGSQILVRPPGTTQPYLPSNVTASMEMDQRQLSHFQMLSSSSQQNLLSNSLAPPLYSISQTMRPFQFSATPRILHCHNSSASQADKEQEFPSK